MRKSGMIPCYYKNGKVYVMYMVPSLEEYGGLEPQMAKGGLEDHLSPQENAFKEALEELGLVKSNVIWSDFIGEYHKIGVYVCQIKNRYNFIDYGYETGETGWLSEDEIYKVRSWQQQIFKDAIEFFKQKMGH